MGLCVERCRTLWFGRDNNLISHLFTIKTMAERIFMSM